jgi:formamidopyrimidine-DNA glycosylase
MPELPEVETIARGLAARVTGDVIESVWIGGKPEPLKSPARVMVRTLQGARIARVRRVGKHVVFDLSRRAPSRRSSVVGRRPSRRNAEEHAQWIVHLGMTGNLVVCAPGAELAKHTHAIVRLASGKEIRFVDPRRFGRLAVHRDFRAPGSEPLDLGVEIFSKLFRGRKTPIKSALLNQKLLSGVGNIYADEALFRAGIRPRRRAASVTRNDLRRLYEALQQVLNEAIAAGGSSVSDYVDAAGNEGLFQLEHRVYQRTGEPCLVCRTPIKRVVLAGRSAHYCPKCQT